MINPLNWGHKGFLDLIPTSLSLWLSLLIAFQLLTLEKRSICPRFQAINRCCSVIISEAGLCLAMAFSRKCTLNR